MKRMDCQLRIAKLKSALSRLAAHAAPDRAPIRNPKSKIQNPPLRSGISLLEVLISMFVLLFGLMGVAAIFPVGNHYAGKGDQYDRAAVLSEAGFAELKSRGMLRPEHWLYAFNPVSSGDLRVISPTTGGFMLLPTGGPGHAFVIDPLGEAEGRAAAAAAAAPPPQMDVFPHALFSFANPTGMQGNNPLLPSNFDNPWRNPVGGLPALSGTRWPIRRVTLPTTSLTRPTMPVQVAETIARLRDDLAVELPDESDRPGKQLSRADRNGKPLSRQYTGNYSWLATVVPKSGLHRDALQPNQLSYGSPHYDVSVAVFYKRHATPSAESERAIDAALNLGGELVLYAQNPPGNPRRPGVQAVDAAVKGLRPGQWIALAGVQPGTGLFLLKWYRLLSLDEETAINSGINTAAGSYAVRRAMLEGPDWPAPASGQPYVNNLRAIILPGIINVSTQQLPMDGESRGALAPRSSPRGSPDR